MKNEFDLPQKVFDIIIKETNHYTPVGVEYLLREAKNRKYGEREVLVYFDGDNAQVLGKQDLDIYENSEFIKIRAALIANIIKEYTEKYPHIKDKIKLVIPFAFSDTSDTQVQNIPCLTFSKRAYSNNILIPSINNLAGYTDVSLFPQINGYDIPLLSKEDKMCFVGSFTDNELKESTRIQIAKLALKNPDKFFCRIIRPPRFNEDEYNKIYIDTKATFQETADEVFINSESKITLDKQLPYKFQITADGHTCAWARLPWQMQSNSVPLKIRNRLYDWQEWFYPLLDPASHFLEVDIDDLIPTFEYLKNNVREQVRIDQAGRDFVSEFLSEEIAKSYLVQTILILSAKFKGLQ